MIVLSKPQTLKEQISEKGICFFDVKVELGCERVKGERACSALTPLASKCCAWGGLRSRPHRNTLLAFLLWRVYNTDNRK